MAANYWASYASASLVSQQRLCNAHQEDRARGLTESHIQQLKVFFIDQIWELSRTCKLRYRVAATASAYFRRFYMRNSFGSPCSDPRLVYVGCLYLASKTEETLLAAKHLVVYVRRLQPNWPYDMKHLLDSEMVIIQELDFMLVVFHPYGPLLQYIEDIQAPTSVAQAAWATLNDLYRSDIPLMYPPHILALACLLYAWTATSRAALCTHRAGGAADAAGAATGGASPAVVEQGAKTNSRPGVVVREDDSGRKAGGHTHRQQAAAAAGQLQRSGDSDSASDNGHERCLAWLLQLNVDLPSVLQVVEQLQVFYSGMLPILSAEECKRLLDIAMLSTQVSGTASQQPVIT